MSIIGDNIKFLREHHKFTPTAVAKKLNINVQDYNAWESGLLLPTIDRVMSLCAIYKVQAPTDLFSESFVQNYNAKEVKSLKEAAIKKAQEEANFNGSVNSKLNFVIPDGSYYSNPLFFTIAIVLAFGLLAGFFLPCFATTSGKFIGYVAFNFDLVTTVLVYAVAAITILFIVLALRFNYKILFHNEFYPKQVAARIKLIYIAMPLLILGLNIAIFIMNQEIYDLGLAVVTAVAICMFLASIAAITSIKPARPDSITYSYVMKFSKYRIKTDAPRKALLVFGIIGLILSLASVALFVIELFIKGGVIGMLGVESGMIKDFSNIFKTVFDHVNTGIPVMAVLGVCAAGFIYLQVADIALSNILKKQFHKGDIKADDVKYAKRLNIINLVIGICVYVMAYATIILGLVSNADARLVAAENYIAPILTGISAFVVARLSVNIKVHFVYRGSETKEVTGFSEVQLDEEAKQKKSGKKPAQKTEQQESQPKAPAKEPKKAKEPKAKKEGKTGEVNNQAAAEQPASAPAQPQPTVAPNGNAADSGNKGGQN